MFKNVFKKTKDLIKLHVAGATVRHKSKFSDLEIFSNEEELDAEFINKYVSPFYMTSDWPEYKKSYIEIRSDIDKDVVLKLLGEFNWRPRSVGAQFVALEDMSELETNIGNLLLRSDVCYAGHEYCIALASFASPSAVDFLNQYLDYYLGKPNLWFNQNSAMGALSYLGGLADKDLLSLHMEAWHKFVKNKPNWNLQRSIDGFKAEMEEIAKFKLELNSK